MCMEMSRLTRDETAEAVSRDQILRREQGQGNISFSCSADDEQDWQPYPVDPYHYYYIHTYMVVPVMGDALTGHHGPINARLSFPAPTFGMKRAC